MRTAPISWVIAALALSLGAVTPAAAQDKAPEAAPAPAPATPAAQAAPVAPPTAAPAAAPAGPPAGEDPQALFHEANARYLAGDYGLAARLYGRVLTEHRLEDPVLYANLGNAYFRAGAFGSAIFFYRRGLRLQPSGEVADRLQANLETTRRVLQRRYRTGADSSQFIFEEPGGLAYRVTHLVDGGLLTGLLLVLWCALFGALVWRRLAPRVAGLGPTAIGAAVAALLVGLLLWGQVYTDRAFRLGVIISDGVTLREGRHEDARGVDIPEGMEVRIVESDENWARIELTNGREGWVEAQTVKQI